MAPKRTLWERIIRSQPVEETNLEVPHHSRRNTPGKAAPTRPSRDPLPIPNPSDLTSRPSAQGDHTAAPTSHIGPLHTPLTPFISRWRDYWPTWCCIQNSSSEQLAAALEEPDFVRVKRRREEWERRNGRHWVGDVEGSGNWPGESGGGVVGIGRGGDRAERDFGRLKERKKRAFDEDIVLEDYQSSVRRGTIWLLLLLGCLVLLPWFRLELKALLLQLLVLGFLLRFKLALTVLLVQRRHCVLLAPSCLGTGPLKPKTLLLSQGSLLRDFARASPSS